MTSLDPYSTSPPAGEAKRRSAMAILVAFALWVTGVIVLFPPATNTAPSSQALKSQAEAHVSLRRLATHQLEHHHRKGHFAYDFNAVGFRPDPPVRYVIAFPLGCTTRYASPTAVTSSLDLLSRGIASSNIRPRTLTIAEREQITSRLETLIELKCPELSEDFVAFAIGNLDEDPELDVWSIDRSMQLHHVQSDL